MTGVAPSHSVQEDAKTPPHAASPIGDPQLAFSCDCRPHTGVYCPEGDGLIRLYDRAGRLDHQYGDRLPVNIAVFTLSVHWGLDRPATLLALLNKPWEVGR